jgi:hypothetical protein
MSNKFLPVYPVQDVSNSQNTQYAAFNAINIPYGQCLLQSNPNKRQGAPGPDVFGDGIHYTECIPKVIQPGSVIGPQNTKTVNTMDSFFFKDQIKPAGASTLPKGGPTNLQSVRPEQTSENYYIRLASSSLHISPDLLLSLLFFGFKFNTSSKHYCTKGKRNYSRFRCCWNSRRCNDSNTKYG